MHTMKIVVVVVFLITVFLDTSVSQTADVHDIAAINLKLSRLEAEVQSKNDLTQQMVSDLRKLNESFVAEQQKNVQLQQRLEQLENG